MIKQIWIDLRVRLSAIFRRQSLNARAREEMEFHVAMREQQLADRGVPANEARSQARREFGNGLLLQEATADSWRYAGMNRFVHDIANDLAYAARCLRRSPGFTLAAIVTIALGIGVNAGIFTVLNGVLFRDLPAPEPDGLVSILQTVQGGGDPMAHTFSTSEYFAYRDRAQTFSGVLAYSGARGETTVVGDVPRKVLGALVSCNYFAVLQQPPVFGHGLSQKDCEPGAEPVVVLGYELWRTAFSGDPGVVGRPVEMNRKLFTIVGVAAEGTYSGPITVGYFAPISAGKHLGRDGRYEDATASWLSLIGRRRDDANLKQVRADLDVIAAQIDQQQPGRSTTLTIERAKWMTVPPSRRGFTTGVAAVLMAAFGFVLLIACANVANLLLARGTARSREIGIRLSLGASRARVIRQLLTESALLSVVGGILGSVLALWSFQSLVARTVPSLMPPELGNLVWNLGADFRVLAFAAALTCLTGILFGLAPALHASKPDLHSVTKQDSAVDGRRLRGGRLRAILVGVQVMLCMTLMIAAGLLLRGLYTTYTVDPGFNYDGVAYVNLEELESAGYEAAEASVFRRRVAESVRALPGVTAIAWVQREPLGDDFGPGPIRLPGESEREARLGDLNLVSSNYFSLLEMPIVRGRPFTAAEVSNAASAAGARPAIVSETTARNLWPERDPIGRTLLFGPDTLQVVGVVADAQLTKVGVIDPYYIYVPGEAGLLMVKSRTEFGSTAAAIQAAVRGFDRTMVVRVVPLESTLVYWRGLSGTVSVLAAGLGVLALALASIGIYGVISYAVKRRYREIGIRMALGAGAGNVLKMILQQTMLTVVVGAVIGSLAGIAMSNVLASVLFGISPVDPIGLGGAVLVVLGVALCAGVIAVRPATHADTTAVLRYE